MPMPYTQKISEEASILSRQSSNVDNYRLLYSIKEEDPDGETFLVKFVAPKLLAFENYRFYLLKNSVIKPLQPNFYYRPDYLSFEEYGTINWWALLLYINDVPTLEDFTIENILVPTGASLLEMSRGLTSRNLITEIVPLYDTAPPATPSLFSGVDNIPFFVPLSTTSTTLQLQKEQFTVDVVMARQKHIDLKFEPKQDTLSLTINGNSNFKHGKHFIMTKFNRLTWDSKKINNGIGLTSILNEGTNFEVSYQRKGQ